MEENFGSEFWHIRFLQQAQWTTHLREHFISEIMSAPGKRIIEIGSGTGAALDIFSGTRPELLIGLDINHQALKIEDAHFSTHTTVNADGLHLPFPDSSFDLCLCHYFLLWVAEPTRAVSEMLRITKTGGTVAAFAEPDYGGRIDSVEYSAELKDIQIKTLQALGANPSIGRNLPDLMLQAGLDHIQSGILGAEWQFDDQINNFQHDYSVLTSDLKKINDPALKAEVQAVLDKMKNISSGISFVPTFYAWGTKKDS